MPTRRLTCYAIVFSQVIGEDLHMAAVVGEKNLLDAKEDLDLDTSWLPEPSSTQSTKQEQVTRKADTALPAKASMARTTAPKSSEPTILSVRSQHMEVEASGWRLPNGDLALRKPASAVLDFTPALAE